ncbi:MAG: energy transducer TonB [Bacteroidia bacterium]|nr:energy transducer TonB [Bacteroidia bacterium]
MRLKIKTPCHEDWESMKIGLNSRFCDQCDKNVVDFTQWDRTQILEYVLRNDGSSMCARMNRSQLDFHHRELATIITTRKLPQSSLFLLLSMGVLVLTACQQKQSSTPMIELEVETTSEVVDSTTGGHCQVDTAAQSNLVSDSVPPPIGMVDLLGQVMVIPKDTSTEGGDTNHQVEPQIYKFVDQMPQFPGGMDSMHTYLQAHVEYPDGLKAEGTVYAKTIIRTDGSVEVDEVFMRGMDSDQLIKQVTRAIEKMPKWVPGSLNGRLVDVYYTIPVRFVRPTH